MTATVRLAIPIEVARVNSLSQKLMYVDLDIGFLAARETKPVCRTLSVTSRIEHCPVAYH
jgi:hypothetical protein